MRALLGGLIATLVLIIVLLTSWAMTMRAENEKLEETLLEQQASQDLVNARWREMHKEATGRASMWLGKLNEVRKRHPEGTYNPADPEPDGLMLSPSK